MVKIFQYSPQRKEGNYGFNLGLQIGTGDDSTQILIVGFRVMFGKIFGPALKSGQRYIQTFYTDINTAYDVYDALSKLPDPPIMEPVDIAIQPMITTQKVIDSFCKEKKEDE